MTARWVRSRRNGLAHLMREGQMFTVCHVDADGWTVLDEVDAQASNWCKYCERAYLRLGATA